MNVITMSAIIVTLFLGGPHARIDIRSFPAAIEGTVWFFLKLLVFLYMFVWLRATLPRLRYDQLMDLGWKVLIPLALGWFLLLAALRSSRPTARCRLGPVIAIWSSSALRPSGCSCGAPCESQNRRADG